jgi:Na+-driven multidrug efflux pump
MDKSMKRLGEFVTGAYAWLISISFGMVLLDVQYARLIPGEKRVFSEISDYLLWTSAFTLAAGVGAILFAWGSKPARYYFILSLLAGFVAPAVFLAGVVEVQPDSGAWVRIGSSGLAAALAFLGLYWYYREG